MVRQGGSYMRVCGVNLRCGSLYDSNPIKIHYLCFINMFTLSLSLSHTHTQVPQENSTQIWRRCKDDRVLTYLLTYSMEQSPS